VRSKLRPTRSLLRTESLTRAVPRPEAHPEEELSRETPLMRHTISVVFLLCLAASSSLLSEEDASTLVRSIQDSEAPRKLAALGETAVPALLEALEASEHADVVLHVLGEIGDVSSLPAILKRTSAPVIEHRLAACYALRKFRKPEATSAAVKLLRDPADRVRMAALCALNAQQASSQAPAIADLLDDQEWRVRKEATRILGVLGAKGAAPDLMKRLHFELVEEESAKKDLKKEPILVPEYREPFPTVRMECIQSLGRMGAPKAVEAFVPLLSHGTDPERRAAVDAIQQIGEGVADAVYRDIQALGAQERTDAAETTKRAYLTVALARLNDDRTLKPAVELVSAADVFCQIELIAFLGNRESAEAAPTLAGMLKTAKVEQVHDSLLDALPKMGRPASEALSKLLSDRAVCVDAMKLMGKQELRNPGAIPQFLKNLEDEDFDIRLAAIGALVAHQAKQAVPVLESALVADPDERVREAATDALKALTGKDYRK